MGDIPMSSGVGALHFGGRQTTTGDLRDFAWMRLSSGGQISQVNSRVTHILGWDSSALVGRLYVELFSATDRHSQLPEAHSVLAQCEGEVLLPAQLLSATGGSISVELLYSAIGGATHGGTVAPFSSPLLIVLRPVAG